MTRTTLVTIGLATQLLLGSPSHSATQAVTELEGVWVVETIARLGAVRRVPENKMVFAFRGSELITEGLAGPGEIRFEFKTDPKSSPKTLDYFSKTSHISAIYMRDGERLTIATPGPDKVRPKNLDIEGNANILSLRLRK